MRGICNICSELFLSSNNISATPCGHMFHNLCLTKWMAKSETCPQCRKAITLQMVIPKLFFDAGPDDEADPEILQEQIDKLNENLKGVRLEVTHLYDVIDSMLLSDTEKERTIAAMKSEMGKMKSDNEAMQSEVAHLRQENQKMACYQRDTAALKAQLKELESNFTEQKKVKSETVKMTKLDSLDSATLDIVTKDQEISSLKSQVIQLKKDITTERRNVVALDKHLDVLREENKKISAYEKENAALKAKLEQCKNLQIPPSISVKAAKIKQDVDRMPKTSQAKKGRRASPRIAAKRCKITEVVMTEDSKVSSTACKTTRRTPRAPVPETSIVIIDDDDDFDYIDY